MALANSGPTVDEAALAPYREAFLDWLACAHAGAGERAVRALRGAGQGLAADVAVAGAAGHVLDFDDTLSEGVAHVSATCAPAALVLAAHLGRPVGAMLAAYAAGFEAMAALAAASHPALYDAGWHPTAVCGPVGAAAAAASLLELSPAQRESALAAALLRAGGTRGSFGSDGKAISVGLAAAAGVQGALLARDGAAVDPRVIHGPVGFEAILGARWPPESETAALAASGERWIHRNWIKLHPSCLGTHAPIEAAELARQAGHRPGEKPIEVLVHPVARQAAHLDEVGDGLEAKFSIPYCVAFTLRHGPPRVADFTRVDGDVSSASRLVAVTVDGSQPQFGAVLSIGGHEVARVPGPRGSPEHPAATAELEAKVSDLAGDRLSGLLDDLGVPAAAVLEAAGLYLACGSPSA